MIKRIVDINMLQSQYSLEDFLLLSEHKPEQHIELLGFVINPIFARSSRFLIKEVLRQLNATCVYYNLELKAPIPDVLSEFVQVQPRAQFDVPASLSTELAATDSDGCDTATSSITPAADRALFFLTRKLIAEPKIVDCQSPLAALSFARAPRPPFSLAVPPSAPPALHTWLHSPQSPL